MFISCCVRSTCRRLDLFEYLLCQQNVLVEWKCSCLHTTHFSGNSNIQLFSNKICQLNSDIIISCFPTPACFSRMKHVLCRTCYPHRNYVSLVIYVCPFTAYLYFIKKYINIRTHFYTKYTSCSENPPAITAYSWIRKKCV